MNIKNTKLIEILLWSGVKANFLAYSFWIIGKLIKKYGKIIYTTQYTSEILKIDKNLWNLIFILSTVNKIEYKDTKNLIYIIKSNIDNYQKEFVINSSVENKEIISYLHQKFKDSNIENEHIESLWLKISGEWRYYKKDLDSDLNKILK
jgi:hypothetical protein